MPPADPRTDEELIAAASAGDADAFAALYHRYKDWVVGLAWRFTGSRDDALDVLQDTFAYLLRRIPRLHLSARMTTFLYPVVRNLALTRRRKRAREAGGTDAGDDRQQVDPIAPLPAEGGDDLAAVLSVLPAAQREVLLMRFVDDLPLGDIARAMGIPEGTVKSRIHNALNALRDHPRTRRYFDQ